MTPNIMTAILGCLALIPAIIAFEASTTRDATMTLAHVTEPSSASLVTSTSASILTLTYWSQSIWATPTTVTKTYSVAGSTYTTTTTVLETVTTSSTYTTMTSIPTTVTASSTYTTMTPVPETIIVGSSVQIPAASTTVTSTITPSAAPEVVTTTSIEYNSATVMTVTKTLTLSTSTESTSATVTTVTKTLTLSASTGSTSETNSGESTPSSTSTAYPTQTRKSIEEVARGYNRYGPRDLGGKNTSRTLGPARRPPRQAVKLLSNCTTSSCDPTGTAAFQADTALTSTSVVTSFSSANEMAVTKTVPFPTPSENLSMFRRSAMTLASDAATRAYDSHGHPIVLWTADGTTFSYTKMVPWAAPSAVISDRTHARNFPRSPSPTLTATSTSNATHFRGRPIIATKVDALLPPAPNYPTGSNAPYSLPPIVHEPSHERRDDLEPGPSSPVSVSTLPPSESCSPLGGPGPVISASPRLSARSTANSTWAWSYSRVLNRRPRLG